MSATGGQGHREETERLREIERVFNEGWLPEIPGERGSLRLRSLYRLRELIPESSVSQGPEGTER